MPAPRPAEYREPDLRAPGPQGWKAVKVGAAATFEVMMNVTVTLLGRATIGQPFTELGTQTVTLGADPLPLTPAVPPGAIGQELQVRVASAESLKFATGAWLDPASPPPLVPILDGDGHQIGAQPGPAPRAVGEYGVTGGASRDAPFPTVGGSIVLARLGVPLARG